VFRSADEGGKDALGDVGAGEACADCAGAVVEDYGRGEEGVRRHGVVCARSWIRVKPAEDVTAIEYSRVSLTVHGAWRVSKAEDGEGDTFGFMMFQVGRGMFHD